MTVRSPVPDTTANIPVIHCVLIGIEEADAGVNAQIWDPDALVPSYSVMVNPATLVMISPTCPSPVLSKYDPAALMRRNEGVASMTGVDPSTRVWSLEYGKVMMFYLYLVELTEKTHLANLD